MSYIRSANNPEGLHVWDDTHGHTVIIQAGQMYEVSCQDWTNTIQHYKHDELPFVSLTVEVRETEDLKIALYLPAYAKRIVMWKVTWAYICAMAQEHVEL